MGGCCEQACKPACGFTGTSAKKTRGRLFFGKGGLKGHSAPEWESSAFHYINEQVHLCAPPPRLNYFASNCFVIQ